MLHLGDQITEMFAMLTLAATFHDDGILWCRECRFFEYRRDLLLPFICNTGEARTVERFFEMRINSVRGEKLTREPPQLIERLLHALMTFLAAIAEPDEPMGRVPQVIANFFLRTRRDLGQPLVTANKQRIELQQIK